MIRRLIDAEFLKRRLEPVLFGPQDGYCVADGVIAVIDSMPAENDLHEYGRWYPDERGFYQCNICGYDWDESGYTTPFCPGCGAEMSVYEDDDDDDEEM